MSVSDMDRNLFASIQLTPGLYPILFPGAFTLDVDSQASFYDYNDNIAHPPSGPYPGPFGRSQDQLISYYAHPSEWTHQAQLNRAYPAPVDYPWDQPKPQSVMPIMNVNNPRKRRQPWPTAQELTPPAQTHETPAAKRVRLSSTSELNNSSSSPLRGQPHFPTPPTSASPATTPLKLQIPQSNAAPNAKRLEASRRTAAKKWEPKLQNPFPEKKEIKRAYPMKLMRHYPAEADNIPEPDFIKLEIKKSERVTKLLRSFPGLAPPVVDRTRRVMRAETTNETLKLNKRNTSTDSAMRLAWHCFAIPERGTRAPMMQSGIESSDWVRENEFKPNKLPGWMKWNTSKYCDEKGRAEISRQIREAEINNQEEAEIREEQLRE